MNTKQTGHLQALAISFVLALGVLMLLRWNDCVQIYHYAKTELQKLFHTPSPYDGLPSYDKSKIYDLLGGNQPPYVFRRSTNSENPGSGILPSDYPPADHPDKWVYIGNSKQQCWYHKFKCVKFCQ